MIMFMLGEDVLKRSAQNLLAKCGEQEQYFCKTSVTFSCIYAWIDYIG